MQPATWLTSFSSQVFSPFQAFFYLFFLLSYVTHDGDTAQNDIDSDAFFHNSVECGYETAFLGLFTGLCILSYQPSHSIVRNLRDVLCLASFQRFNLISAQLFGFFFF